MQTGEQVKDEQVQAPVKMRGRVVRFDYARGWGFIRPEDGGRDIFVSWKDCPLQTSDAGELRRFVKEDQVVTYQIGTAPKGTCAVNVEVVG